MEHKSFKTTRTNKAPKFNLSKRGSHTKLYNYKWGKYSKRFLKYNPYCYACGRPSDHVDHVKAAKFHPEHFENLRNHCPMCAQCHAVVTRLFDCKSDGWIQKLKWLESQRTMTKTDISIKILPEY